MGANHVVTINTANVLVGLGRVDADVVDRLVSCYNNALILQDRKEIKLRNVMHVNATN